MLGMALPNIFGLFEIGSSRGERQNIINSAIKKVYSRMVQFLHLSIKAAIHC